MMDTGAYVISIVDQDDWRIFRCDSPQPRCVRVDVPADASAQQTAQHLAEALRQHGHNGEAVALTIPSSWCLCAGVDTEGLPRKGARSAMIYRLEEMLPVAVEETVCDFIAGDGRSLGVCVESQKIAPIVQGLEREGISIELICPAALLALQHKIDTANGDGCDTVIWADGRATEFFSIENKKPTAWMLVPSLDDDDMPVQLGLRTLHRTPPLRLAAFSVDDAVRQQLAAMPDVQVVTQDDQPILTAAATAAQRAVCGNRASWINLRRDGLASGDRLRQIRRPLSAAAAAAILFLACLSASMLWRAHQYQQIASGFEARQRDLYRQLFPNRPVPVNITSRLASEQRRLAGLRGDHEALPAHTPVLLLLQEAISCLPTQDRFQIFEMQLDEGNLFIEGQVRTHSQAEAIAAALNKLKRFRVDPPRTEKLSGDGVAFTIRGTTVRHDPAKEKT